MSSSTPAVSGKMFRARTVDQTNPQFDMDLVFKLAFPDILGVVPEFFHFFPAKLKQMSQIFRMISLIMSDWSRWNKRKKTQSNCGSLILSTIMFEHAFAGLFACPYLSESGHRCDNRMRAERVWRFSLATREARIDHQKDLPGPGPSVKIHPRPSGGTWQMKKTRIQDHLEGCSLHQAPCGIHLSYAFSMAHNCWT